MSFVSIIDGITVMSTKGDEADRTTNDALQVIKYMHKLQELSKVSNRRSILRICLEFSEIKDPIYLH
jgi:hypothetical protein